MARIQIFNKKVPAKQEINGKKFMLCQCGLSANFPFCDGNHAFTQGEDDGLYLYEAGTKHKVEIKKMT